MRYYRRYPPLRGPPCHWTRHRIGVVPALVMTGGVAQNEGVVKALQNELGCEIHRSPLTQYNGALGAALYAYQAASRRA